MTTRRRALAIELVLLLGVFALYLATATRTVQPGDSGELASVAETGAVPHPSGYPLMLIWFRVWSWLPASTPAHRAGLATALSGGLAIGAVYVACRAWGATRAAGWISALSFALSPLAWRLATEPEVFMLNVGPRPFGDIHPEEQSILRQVGLLGVGSPLGPDWFGTNALVGSGRLHSVEDGVSKQ